MGRIAFVFPGQGAQEVGMGRDLMDGNPFVEELFKRGSRASECDLARLCARGPDRLLRETAFLQPALTAVCLGLWHHLDNAGIKPHVTAGHSLGELPALAASGFCDPMALMDLATLRGRVMAEAAKKNPGGMAAVTGLTLSQIEPEIEKLKPRGTIGVAAVNAPTQVAISGDAELLAEMKTALSSHPAAKVTPLRVSGAWHSEHMEPGVAPFERALEKIHFKTPRAHMVFNRHGNVENNPAKLRDLIGKQLVRPIRWDRVMMQLDAMEITHIVEIGPGRTLRGLCRLNPYRKDVTIINISGLRSLERALDSLQNTFDTAPGKARPCI